MIYRALGHNDYKGVNDLFKDNHVVTNSFQFYASNSVEDVFDRKYLSNSKLNEPLGIFEEKIRYSDINSI